MKLKALLLGSAAAMIAVTGARAADAVVAEPEPVEYVRVCDLYGSGFFYIPGTETCLAISGEVRVQYEYTSLDNVTVAAGSVGATLLPAGTYSFDSVGEPNWYGRVNFDARSETDYGTLRSYIRLGEENGTNAAEAGVTVKDAYIELGGLSTGYRTKRVEGPGHVGLMLDGLYGGGRNMYMDYTYAANGFSATAGVLIDSARAKSVDGYLTANYSGSLFTLRGKVAYDTSESETFYGASVDVTPIDGLTVRAYYEAQTGASEYGLTASTAGVGIAGNTAASDYAWGISAQYAILDNLSVAAGYAQAEYDAWSAAPAYSPEESQYTLGINWTPVANLSVRANYRHRDFDTGVPGISDVSADEFRVRIQRNF